MMFEKICEILAEKFDADASAMTMETSIKDDLKADSLDVVTLLMCIEDEFGVTVSDEEAQELRQVGDIVAYIEAHM